MKKLLVGLGAIVFLIGIIPAWAQETVVTAKPQEAIVDTIPYGEMSDMQIAMMLINNQFEYLLKQLTEKDERLTRQGVDYEEKLDREKERNTEMMETLQNRITQLEEQLAGKEIEVKEVQSTMNRLEKQTAVFISDSWLYLKILLGFLAGIIFGIVLGAILQWWKKRSKS